MKQTPLPIQNSPRLVYAVATALMCSTVSLTPPAAANSDHVPWGVLNEIRGSLDDISGASMECGQSSARHTRVGSVQKRDAEVGLAMVSHGVHYKMATETAWSRGWRRCSMT